MVKMERQETLDRWGFYDYADGGICIGDYFYFPLSNMNILIIKVK